MLFLLPAAFAAPIFPSHQPPPPVDWPLTVSTFVGGLALIGLFAVLSEAPFRAGRPQDRS